MDIKPFWTRSKRKTSPSRMPAPASAVALLFVALGLSACSPAIPVLVKPEVPSELMNHTSKNLWLLDETSSTPAQKTQE